jgi:hypothetical protein
MPPLQALAAEGYHERDWAKSEALAALRGHAENALRKDGGLPDRVLNKPFERLRPCLPAAAHYAGTPAHAAGKPSN